MKKIVILAFLALNANAQYQYTISEIPQNIQQSMYVSGAIKEGVLYCLMSFVMLQWIIMVEMEKRIQERWLFIKS